MTARKGKVIDTIQHEYALSVLNDCAKQIVRTYAQEPMDHSLNLTDVVYTLRVLVVQRAYELLGNNKLRTEHFLRASPTTVRKYIEGEGRIDVE